MLVKQSLIDKETLQMLLTMNLCEKDADLAEEAFREINAFDVPRLRYNSSRKCFEPLIPSSSSSSSSSTTTTTNTEGNEGVKDNNTHSRPSLHASPDAKIALFRARWWLLYQRMLRHPKFAQTLSKSDDADISKAVTSFSFFVPPFFNNFFISFFPFSLILYILYYIR